MTSTTTSWFSRIAAVLCVALLGCVAGGGRGDVNGNGTIEPSDIMYLINYMFAHGPQP